MYYFNQSTGLLERFIEYYILPKDTQYSEFILNKMYIGHKEKTFSKNLSDTLSFYLQTYASVEEKTLIEHSNAIKPLEKEAPCPLLEVTTLRNGKINLQKIKSKILFIDLWFATCGPCQLTLPKLNDLYTKYKDRGLVIIGLNPFDNDKILTRQLKKTPISFPIGIINREMAANTFGIRQYPTLLIFDRNKKLVSTEYGYSPDYESKLETIIQNLLNE